MVLTPVRDSPWRLIDQGYEANWFSYVEFDAAEHSVELERHLLERLPGLPGDLWLDVA